MSIVFSDTSTNLGILQQARVLAGVDATHWPTARVVASANNWLDFVAGYAIGADRRFQWDDTNHTKLPEGTTDLTVDVVDYSFLTDEQGNAIVTLTGVSVKIGDYYVPLIPVDRNEPSYDPATFGQVSGTPTRYDKIADNIIRLDLKPEATVSAGLKFYFQRTPSYFAAADTTKAPGVSPLLHRGFVIASAYDIALTLGLGNFAGIAAEKQLEVQKVIEYFSNRNQDEPKVMTNERIEYM